jgi:choline dehydrogenase-like flavoprotein
MDFSDIEDDGGSWDAIVIGTGMGGGMAGRRLAEHGLRVLFLEKGHAIDRESTPEAALLEGPADRMLAGHWPDRFATTIDDERADIYAALGCGVGGSTLLYSAALERMERHDLESQPGLPHPTGGWPVSFDEMTPYYEQAERHLMVRGTVDPRCGEPACMDRPPPMRAMDAVLMSDLARAGMEPYRMHVGIAYKPGCGECLGSPCPRACKSDANLCGVQPALSAGAELRTGASVERIEADDARVTGVVYRQSNSSLHRVTAPTVIVAAGTLGSAALLLRSQSPIWPNGLANGSGHVGRNLMFHADDWLAVWPSSKANSNGPAKTIASRALYLHGRERIGMLQSTGLSAGYGNILIFLYVWFDKSAFRALRFIRPLLRVPAKVAAKLFGSATILALIIEDLPYEDNRIELDPRDPSRTVIHYRFRDELRERCCKARELLQAKLGASRRFWLRNRAILNWGHPMGTCRFGDDPANSVLDRDCKAHGLENLYVVDGSFMPTGGGVNPSLTIAANALRVADVIAGRHASPAPAARESIRPVSAS